MTSPSAVCIRAVELVVLPLVIVRPVTPVLSRIARPVPVCSSVPRFVSALLPEMLTAFPLPLTMSVPVSEIVPVSPLPKVCEEVESGGIVKLVAKAGAVANRAKAAIAPV
jgi:hypothetical protein